VCTQESFKSSLKYQCIAEKCNIKAISITELLGLVLVAILLKRWSTKLQNLPEIPVQIENGMYVVRKM